MKNNENFETLLTKIFFVKFHLLNLFEIGVLKFLIYEISLNI